MAQSPSPLTRGASHSRVGVQLPAGARLRCCAVLCPTLARLGEEALAGDSIQPALSIDDLLRLVPPGEHIGARRRHHGRAGPALLGLLRQAGQFPQDFFLY